MKLKTIRNIFLVLAVIIVTFGSGFKLGENKSSKSVLSDANSGKDIPRVLSPSNVDLSLFWDVWNRLNRYYIEKKALDSQKMIYGAISGMVTALGDPYTVFLPPEQNKEAKDDLGGIFEGIGIQLGIKDKRIVVIAALKGTPAARAGLKPGDLILKVDDKDTADWTLPEAVSKIRGQKGTKVKLYIYKQESSSSAEIQVERDTINVASVEWEILDVRCEGGASQCRIVREKCDACSKEIYLKLSRFGDQTTEEWNKAIDEITKVTRQFAAGQLKGLIFDLRNNPGGYLTGSVFIASEFIKDGTIVSQESIKAGKQTFSVDRKGKLTDIPMAVLINKGTASAGEIVAGALQERNRAKLVGETTFGKGSVQEAQDLPKGAGIHITVAKWLLPSGKWIKGTGVDPDIRIKNDETKPDEDLQLLKAAEYLEK